ncbi:hypothetical protein GCM10020001_017140 [Nonomuraea salmonea]
MFRDTKSSWLSTLRYDVPASLVVFLVAVPLSLGIAMASGAPLVAGLIAAVVGGVVAGSLGGSAVQVSGPAAGLSLVVVDLVHTYGWRATCMITLLAGAVQLVLGVFKAARAALMVSPAVIHGMLAAVGVIIALAQLHIVLGGSSQRSAVANLVELPGQIANLHGHKVAVGVLTILVLALWTRLPKPVKVVPAPLAALFAAAVTTWAFGWDVTRVDLSDSVTEWAFPVLPQGDWHLVVAAVLLVALLAGCESLLCCVAVDGLHTGRRADLDQELTGQGVANMVTGALGGLPVAGVIVRSSANVQAGARTRWSAILHGVWVLVFAFGFGWTITLIPLEALAALLVFIGVQMVNLGHIKKVHGHGEVPVYVVTMVAVILLGLAEGVLAGLALAALLALRRLTMVTVLKREDREGRLRVTISGSLTFLGVPRLTHELRAVPTGAHVDLDLNIDFMDNAAFEALHSWRLDHERTGGTVDIDELHDEWYTLAASGGRTLPKKSPLKAPDRSWLPWAHRRRAPAEPPDSVGGGRVPAHRGRARIPPPYGAARAPDLHRAGPQAAAVAPVHHLRRLQDRAQPDHRERPRRPVHRAQHRQPRPPQGRRAARRLGGGRHRVRHAGAERPDHHGVRAFGVRGHGGGAERRRAGGQPAGAAPVAAARAPQPGHVHRARRRPAAQRGAGRAVPGERAAATGEPADVPEGGRAGQGGQAGAGRAVLRHRLGPRAHGAAAAARHPVRRHARPPGDDRRSPRSG